jgi:hypothetical protein
MSTAASKLQRASGQEKAGSTDALLPSRRLPNVIAEYTRSVFKSELARMDGKLAEDVGAALSGHCLYLRNALCPLTDFSLLRSLMADMEARESDASAPGTGMINWSKHYKYDDPDFSPTFQRVLAALSDYFDVDIHATRLNFYPDASSWKPFHHDSHAYGLKGVREDFTMGASFGAARDLAFLHPSSGQTFSFPQTNGDIFAFDTDVNKRFQHGVPRAASNATGPRFSIIAWGRRRQITERNGGLPGSRPTENPVNADAERRAQKGEREDTASAQGQGLQPAYDASGKINEKGPDIAAVSALVAAFIAAEEERAAAATGGNAAAGGRALKARGLGSRQTSGQDAGAQHSSGKDKMQTGAAGAGPEGSPGADAEVHKVEAAAEPEDTNIGAVAVVASGAPAPAGTASRGVGAAGRGRVQGGAFAAGRGRGPAAAAAAPSAPSPGGLASARSAWGPSRAAGTPAAGAGAGGGAAAAAAGAGKFAGAWGPRAAAGAGAGAGAGAAAGGASSWGPRR